MVVRQLCHVRHLSFLPVCCVFEISCFAFSSTELPVAALNLMCSVPLHQFSLMLKEPSDSKKASALP